MQEFIHHKVKTIEELFAAFNNVQQLYTERSFDFEAQFNTFLEKLLDYFKTKGNNVQESDISRIINRLLTVKKGFNPIKLEKITTGKRELYWGFSFSAMEEIQVMLTEIHQKEKAKLEEGEELISNLALSLHQNNMLDDQKIKDLDSVPKIEAYWNYLLTQNGTISSINKKLRMNLIAEDIYLLFEKVISKIA